MAIPITIKEVKLEGFRAYLKPRTIKLSSGNAPQSYALFAPNGNGKSSLVDSFEMYFSKESNLEHLGKIKTAIQAGRDAIPHVDAEKLGITPRVHFWFKQGEIEFDDS